MNKEKLKVLIDSIKTANDLMRKQIEINGRAVELLGEFITEPESIEVNEAINWWNTLTNKQQWDYRYELIGHRGGVLEESEIEEIWRKKTQQVEPYIKPSSFCGTFEKYELKDATIKPEDMKAGEWYVNFSKYNQTFLFKFKALEFSEDYIKVHYFLMANQKGSLFSNNYIDLLYDGDYIRKATQQEILKYFPHELEVDTHGGNDAAYIQEVTDPQV